LKAAAGLRRQRWPALL